MALGGGPMKVTPAACHGPGKGGVLGKKAVAGVDGVRPAGGKSFQDGLEGEVALSRRLATEGVGLVGKADVQSVLVELGVDRDGSYAELAAGPDDPHGDLAAVGHEHFLEHRPPFST